MELRGWALFKRIQNHKLDMNMKIHLESEITNYIFKRAEKQHKLQNPRG